MCPSLIFHLSCYPSTPAVWSTICSAGTCMSCRQTGLYIGPKGITIIKDNINFKSTGVFSFLFHVYMISKNPKKRTELY